MGDVLCKWRMPKVKYVVELVQELPKEEMAENEFKTYMSGSIYGEGFTRTAYQLACQLGLYCIDNQIYIPRFNRNVSENEAESYLEKWVWTYYIPNPYTKSFAQGCKPLPVLTSIIKYIEENPDVRNLEQVCQNIWGEPIGNLANIKYAINQYSKAVRVNDYNNIILEPNYKEIMTIALERNNKRAFFDSLSTPSETGNPENKQSVEPAGESTKLNSQEYSYIAAIKTKPFLILGGFSGTGKSQKVKELAFATCPCDGYLNMSETSPGNYLLVSVKPNWHDATDITGFRSSVNKNYYATDFMRFLVKAKQYPEVPFFVCLDEMNLAPVEEYFADFLSVIESRKKKKDGTIVTDALVPASVFRADDYDAEFNIFMSLGLATTNLEWKPDELNALSKEEYAQAFIRQDIVEELKRDGLTIPQNVIIIGTVNMDDTTNSFSRKVIDRAMTFETIVNEFDDSYFAGDVALHYISKPRSGKLFISDEVRATQMIEAGNFVLTDDEKHRILEFINSINTDLEGSPFKISYRILNETILLYRAKKEIQKIMDEEGGFEDGVTFNTDLDNVFDEILMQKILPRIEGDYEKCNKCLTKLSARADDNNWKQSMDKIEFMITRFGKDKSGFTSFWN